MAHEHPKYLPSNRLCVSYVLTKFKHSCCIPPILSPHCSPSTCRLTRPAARRLITGSSLSGAARGPPTRRRRPGWGHGAGSAAASCWRRWPASCCSWLACAATGCLSNTPLPAPVRCDRYGPLRDGCRMRDTWLRVTRRVRDVAATAPLLRGWGGVFGPVVMPS